MRSVPTAFHRLCGRRLRLPGCVFRGSRECFLRSIIALRRDFARIAILIIWRLEIVVLDLGPRTVQFRFPRTHLRWMGQGIYGPGIFCRRRRMPTCCTAVSIGLVLFSDSGRIERRWSVIYPRPQPFRQCSQGADYLLHQHRRYHMRPIVPTAQASSRIRIFHELGTIAGVACFCTCRFQGVAGWADPRRNSRGHRRSSREARARIIVSTS